MYIKEIIDSFLATNLLILFFIHFNREKKFKPILGHRRCPALRACAFL